MPFSFDIHENEFLEEVFQQGREQGLQEAKEKLLQEVFQEGRLESARQLLPELLEAKFGTLPSATREQISNASFEEIQLWQRRALGSDSLSSLFTTT